MRFRPWTVTVCSFDVFTELMSLISWLTVQYRSLYFSLLFFHLNFFSAAEISKQSRHYLKINYFFIGFNFKKEKTKNGFSRLPLARGVTSVTVYVSFFCILCSTAFVCSWQYPWKKTVPRIFIFDARCRGWK